MAKFKIGDKVTVTNLMGYSTDNRTTEMVGVRGTIIELYGANRNLIKVRFDGMCNDLYPIGLYFKSEYVIPWKDNKKPTLLTRIKNFFKRNK